MDSPLVSCVVPAHDAERFLDDALESILAQTHRPIEIVVVDDGSTDDTEGVVRFFAERHPDAKVRYLRQENQGPAAARNRGIRASCGQFVAFLDADDLWSPDKLETQLARFRERPELDACYAHARNFWMPEVREEEERLEGSPRSGPHPSYVAGTLLARRHLFERLGGFDEERIHSDVPAWRRKAVREGAAIETVDDVLLRRRLHRDNLSRQASDDQRRELLAAVKDHLERKRGGGHPEEEAADSERAESGAGSR